MTSPDPLQQVFDAAKREFDECLPSNTKFRDILAIDTVDKVWDAIKQLQRDLEKKSHLRHMSRMQPFLDRLRSYSAVIEVFVQVKPDVLALLWGPIRLLLQWTGEWQQGFDAIVKTMERIGDLLPQFGDVAKHFIDKELIKDVLALFYRDILDFYLESLKFFGLPRKVPAQGSCPDLNYHTVQFIDTSSGRKIMFETLWPKRKEKIKIVEANIERHTQLLRENITLEHIRREHEARTKLFEEFQESEVFRTKQMFQAIESAVCPQMYDDRLYWLQTRVCRGTEIWLARDRVFSQWMNMDSPSPRLLWLQGIPGAGEYRNWQHTAPHELG
jgi:hypothetical protein